MWTIVTDGVAWSVSLRSVCRSVCHNRELWKHGWTDRDAVWVVDSDGPKKSYITWEQRYSMRRRILIF